MSKLTESQQALICRAIPTGTQKIVLLDVLGEKDLSPEELNANIYCISEDFSIIWQIDPEPTNFEIDSFTSMHREENGKIQARKFSGFEYEINEKNGKATIISWDK